MFQLLFGIKKFPNNLKIPGPFSMNYIRSRGKVFVNERTVNECGFVSHWLRWRLTRATVNAEIPSTAYISMRATCWDRETVGTVKPSRYISMHKGWRPWNSQACEAVYVLMALWWLYGGYLFPVVVRPENSTFQIKFDLEGQGQLPPKT